MYPLCNPPLSHVHLGFLGSLAHLRHLSHAHLGPVLSPHANPTYLSRATSHLG